METVPLSAFLPALRSRVTVPLDGVMLDALAEAAIAFCTRSRVVVEVLSLGPVVKGQHVRLVADSALNQGAPATLRAGELLALTGQGEPLVPGRDVHLADRDTLTFLRDVAEVSVLCSVVPAEGSTHVPALLFADWKHGLCAGAATHLLVQPDWANPDLAAHYETLFNEAVSSARRWRVEASPQTAFQHPPGRHRDFL